jgi:GNAT superfamily N-acetyltransferase
MPVALRHSHDPVPPVTSLAHFRVHEERDVERLAVMQQRDLTAVQQRLASHHRAFIAYVEDAVAGWGWLATRSASIGELGFSFTLPPRDRYLWNFVTVPAYRGRGVYTRLLDEIVRHEARAAEQFWIAYAPENHASGNGIRRAGFVDVAALSFLPTGEPALSDLLPGGAKRAQALLGVVTSPTTLAPCWRCVRAGRRHACASGSCACDYQQPVSGCNSAGVP